MDNLENKLAKSLGINQKKKIGRRFGTKNSNIKKRRVSLYLEEPIINYFDKRLMENPQETVSSIVNNILLNHIEKSNCK